MISGSLEKLFSIDYVNIYFLSTFFFNRLCLVENCGVTPHCLYFYCVRSIQIRNFFSDPYFPVFGLNTESYRVNLRIQSEYRKIRTRKNSVFGYFSRSNCHSLTLIHRENMIHELQISREINHNRYPHSHSQQL